MKQKDHKALGLYLLDSVGDGRIWKKPWHRRFFLLGCIGPDYIPLTYLRGFRQSHAMLGHNARYSYEHICKSIQKLETRGIRRFRDCFALGTLMHYLADSYTYPHTDAFSGNMKAHRQYENELHERFARYLPRAASHAFPMARASEQLSEFLRHGRLEYEKSEITPASDCRLIVTACSGVFQALCHPNATKQ